MNLLPTEDPGRAPHHLAPGVDRAKAKSGAVSLATDDRVRTMRSTRASAGGVPSPAQWVQSAKMSSGSMGPIGQNEFPHWELGSPKMYTDGPVPTPLPSAKSGRPPPTLAKFSSSGPSIGLGGVKTLECE
eukprot:scaffold10537_cov122-Isochrysis_galbana.AAC.4